MVDDFADGLQFRVVVYDFVLVEIVAGVVRCCSAICYPDSIAARIIDVIDCAIGWRNNRNQLPNCIISILENPFKGGHA